MARPAIRGIAGPLFVLVWLSCAWFGSWEWNPNNATRLFAAISIVEDGDAAIDEFEALTIDKARFEGHAYLDKAPGMTLLAVPVVWAADAATGESARGMAKWFGSPALARHLRLRQRLTCALVPALLTALAAVLLLDLGAALTGRIDAALFGALAFALGTPMWGWSTTLFGHAPATALLVAAIWAAWRGSGPGAGRPVAHAALAGAALGLAVLIEHAAALLGAPVGLWALWRIRGWDGGLRGRCIAAATASGALLLLPLPAYNLFAYGTPFRLGYQGVVGFEGMREGLFGLTYPKPGVVLTLLAGPRGMLWVAPVMALAPLGVAAMWRDPARRSLAVLAAAGAILPFLYNAAYAYWTGGNATGPRHALPALAFLALGVAPAYAGLRSRAARALALALLAASIGWNLIIASAEILAPDVPRPGLLALVWTERFAPGYLRTAPGEWWGWSPWQGLALWAAAAGALLLMAVLRAARTPTRQRVRQNIY